MIKEDEEVVQTTLRLYKSDIEKFRIYSGSMPGVSQKECFRELMDIFEKMKDEKREGQLHTFNTYLRNDFNPEKNKKEKLFSAVVAYIDGDNDVNQYLIRGNDRKYYTVKLNEFNNPIYNQCKEDEIKKWNEAIKDEFDVWIGILGNYSFSYEIKLFKDIEEEQYLVEDYFKLIQGQHLVKDHSNKIVQEEYIDQKILASKRYFYVNGKKELQKRLDKNIYLLFSKEKKQHLYDSIEKEIILQKNLKEELKSYYE